MKQIENLEVYASVRRGEVYVDYKGERVLSIPDVPKRVSKLEDEALYRWLMDNYGDVVGDLIFAIEN